MPSRMLAIAASEAAAAEAEAEPALSGEAVPPLGLTRGEDDGGSWRDISALKEINVGMNQITITHLPKRFCYVLTL